jgi:preprotein translocase subunit SecG
MYPFFLSLHILLCLFLISVVLLQPGKGGDLGSAFGGGGGSTIFGPRGPTNVLQQATTVIAVLFMVTSVTLAIYSNRGMMAAANVDDELRLLQEGEQAPPVPGTDPGTEGGAPVEPAPAPAPEAPGIGTP